MGKYKNVSVKQMEITDDTITLEKSKIKISPFEKTVHDLATPVHGILNLSDIIYNDWDKIADNTKKEALKDLWQSAQTLDRLIKALRNLPDEEKSKV